MASDYSNDYRHPADSNLKSVHKAMEYNQAGEPILMCSDVRYHYVKYISAYI